MTLMPNRLALIITCLASILTLGFASVAAPATASADSLAEELMGAPAAEPIMAEPAPAEPAPVVPAIPAPLSDEQLAASLGMHNVLELQTLNLINLDRLGRGVHPLTWDPKLAAVARAHAAEMMATGKISHQGVDGRMPYERIKTGADRVTWAGENIWTYRGRVPHLGPNTMHAAMMDEPHEPGLWNHIWNVLYPGYRRVGIGIVVSPTGVQYLAENFAD